MNYQRSLQGAYFTVHDDTKPEWHTPIFLIISASEFKKKSYHIVDDIFRKEKKWSIVVCHRSDTERGTEIISSILRDSRFFCVLHNVRNTSRRHHMKSKETQKMFVSNFQLLKWCTIIRPSCLNILLGCISLSKGLYMYVARSTVYCIQ